MYKIRVCVERAQQQAFKQTIRELYSACLLATFDGASPLRAADGCSTIKGAGYGVMATRQEWTVAPSAMQLTARHYNRGQVFSY